MRTQNPAKRPTRSLTPDTRPDTPSCPSYSWLEHEDDSGTAYYENQAEYVPTLIRISPTTFLTPWRRLSKPSTSQEIDNL